MRNRTLWLHIYVTHVNLGSTAHEAREYANSAVEAAPKTPWSRWF